MEVLLAWGSEDVSLGLRDQAVGPLLTDLHDAREGFCQKRSVEVTDPKDVVRQVSNSDCTTDGMKEA